MHVSLDLAAVRIIAARLPDDAETHDLLIRLRTIVEITPLLSNDAREGPPIVLATSGKMKVYPPEDDGAEDAEDEVDPWPAGAPTVATPPFGWRRHGKRIVKAKEEQEILRRVLQGVKRGWSNPQVAEDLNGRHLRTRRGSKWDGAGIGRLRKGPIEHAANAKLKERYG